MIFLKKIFKKESRVSHLLQDMVDIHSHLLPGVDDGAPDQESAKKALNWLYRHGVQAIWLTPHIMDHYPINNRLYLTERMDDFCRSCPENIPELRLAGEYMLDVGFVNHLNDGLLTLAGGKVLVETSYYSAPLNIDELLYELFSSKYIPVVAHPERYYYMDKALLSRWKNNGCMFQLNLLSLAGVYGSKKMSIARSFLKDGVYDYVGSDIHQLDMYTRALERIDISGTEQKALERLMENNRELWGF